MSEWVGTLELAIMTALGCALASSMVAVLSYPLLSRALRSRHQAFSTRAAFLGAIAPVALPAMLIAVCFLPGILSTFGLYSDHCLAHAHHPHLCLMHPTAALMSFETGWILLLGLACSAMIVARSAKFCLDSRRWLRQLTSLSHEELDRDIYLVESDAALCLTAGLWRPRTYLSTVLARQLSPEQLTVVIEHERAHARRRDALCQLLARAMSWAHLPWIRARILADLELSCEQACDEEAGRRVGDRLRVAETILVVERLIGAESNASGPGVLAFGESSVPDRLHSLLRPTSTRPAGSLAWSLAIGIPALALSFANPLHHLSEHLVGLLLY